VRRFLILATLALALVAAACSGTYTVPADVPDGVSYYRVQRSGDNVTVSAWTPTPAPTVTVTATPTASPTPTPTPTVTPTPTPTATLTVIPEPYIVVRGFSSSAIDAALATAKARTPATVYFPAGTYSHGTLILPEGVSIAGDGIGKTILPFAMRFPGSQLVKDMTIGGTQTSAFRFLPGAYDVTFEDVRLRGRGSSLWSATDYSRDWNGTVTRQDADFHDVTWRRCEFEYTNRSDADLFSIWWDCRRGGGRVYDVTWEDCTFGVRNSAGAFGCGRVGLIFQPAPSEYGAAGPRVSVNQPNPAFDWSRVDHGAGLAASPDARFGFRMIRTRFVGAASFVSFDLCDYTRAWAVSTYNLREPGDVTAAMKAAAPDRVTSKGWHIDDCWFSDDFRPEYGRDVVVVSSPDNQGGAYNVPDSVRAHDRELYE